jgi:hypothetical protein
MDEEDQIPWGICNNWMWWIVWVLLVFQPPIGGALENLSPANLLPRVNWYLLVYSNYGYDLIAN